MIPNDPSQIIGLYAEGDWPALSSYLQEALMVHAEAGNEVEWARVLSYFGILQLHLNHRDALATVYKQIQEENRRGPGDPRIAASFSRFLALYYVFEGDVEQASLAYQEGLRSFSESGRHEEEAVMLLESLHWLYRFTEPDLFMYQAMERLKQINFQLDGWLDDELSFLFPSHQGSGKVRSPLRLHMKSFRSLHRVHQQMNALFSLLQGKAVDLEVSSKLLAGNRKGDPLHDMMSDLAELIRLAQEQQWGRMKEEMESCTAKAVLFRHPWLRTGMHALAVLLYEKEGLLFSQLHLSQLDIRFHPFRREEREGKLRGESPRFSFSLFGGFTISSGKQQIRGDQLGTKQGKELLVYLLLHSKWKVQKEILLDDLFMGEDVKKLSNRLYVAIHRINRALQEGFGLPKETQLIFIQKGTICLHPDLMEDVDVYHCRKMLSVANQLWLEDQEAAAELVEKARRIAGEDIVPDMLYLDWMDRYREEWKNLYFKSLLKLAEYCWQEGQDDLLEELCVELMERQPLHEGVYRLFTKYLLSRNRVSEAVQWYLKLEREMERDLGIGPSWHLSLPNKQ